MRTVLIVWELGGGLGHLMQLAPLARGLAGRGCTVYAALRYLERARGVFAEQVKLLAAPWVTPAVERQVRPPVNWAHILHNMGWHDAAQLGGLVAAWRSLYELVKPDVVVFDHAPTALLAARGLDFGRVVIGSGFCVPPDEPGRALRNLRPWVEAPHAEPGSVEAFERGMVERANGVLAECGAPSIDRVTQIYGEVEETLLVTVPELDHYGVREGVRYWGPVIGGKDEGRRMKDEGEDPGSGSSAFCLQPSAFPRVYAYLKNFPALEGLLLALGESGCEAVVVCDGVPEGVRGKWAGARGLRFVDEPLDLGREALAGRFDLAVLNAGHGSTAAMLLAGIPALLVPIHLEQGMLARAAERNTGACVQGDHKDAGQVVAKLKEMLEPGNLDRYRDAARRFARKYQALDPGGQVRRMVGRVEELIETRRQGDKGTGGGKGRRLRGLRRTPRGRRLRIHGVRSCRPVMEVFRLAPLMALGGGGEGPDDRFALRAGVGRDGEGGGEGGRVGRWRGRGRGVTDLGPGGGDAEGGAAFGAGGGGDTARTL